MRRRQTGARSPLGATPRGGYELVGSAVVPPKAADAIGSQTVTLKSVTTTIIVPRRTLAAAPLVTSVDLGPRRLVRAVNMLFAAGQAALTGVAIANAGIQLLPWNQPGAFIFGDSERLDFALGLFLVGPITVRTINNDFFLHMLQLTWSLDDVAQPPPNGAGAS